MVRWQQWLQRHFAVMAVRFHRTRCRGIAYLEILVVLALLVLIVGAVVIPSYRAYAAARASRQAAITLAEDLALLEREAQAGTLSQGASLVIQSANPLHYTCYHGRPSDVDPHSQLGSIIVERRFSGVQLSSGPINESTPLLFASNGSAQFVSGGSVASQHQVIDFTLSAASGATQTKRVELNLFTGAVSVR